MAAPVPQNFRSLAGSSSVVNFVRPDFTGSGDLLVILCSPARDGAFPIASTPSGFTQRVSKEWGNDGPISLVYTKTAGASEPSSYTLEFDSSEFYTASMFRIPAADWSGVEADVEYYVAASTETQYVTFSGGEFTGLAADTCLVSWVSCEVGEQLYTHPAGWTEFYENGGSRDNPDRVWSAGAYLSFSAGGSSPAAQWENTVSTSFDNGGLLIAIPPAAGSGGSTGTGTGSSPAATATGEGSRTVLGAGSGDNPAAAAAGSGTRAVSGSGSGVAAVASAAGIGTREVIGSGSGTSPAATGSGATQAEITGTGAGVSPPASGQGAGSRAAIGSGSGAFPAATATGAGNREVKGSGAGEAAASTATGVGLRVVVGAGAGVSPAAIGGGTDQSATTGSGAAVSPASTATGSGFRVVVGSGSGVSPPSIGEGSFVVSYWVASPDRTKEVAYKTRVVQVDYAPRVADVPYRSRVAAVK